MNHATNAAVMRDSNRKLILNMIREAPISRAALAQRAHLTRAAVTQIVDELLAAGLVEPCPGTEAASRLGRKRTLLTLKRGASFAIGMHISRRRCRIGVVDVCGDVLAQHELLLNDRSPEAVADEAAQIIHDQLQRLSLPPERVIGLGVSAPGPVDYRGGVILNPPNFDSWHHVPICRMMQERTGLTTFLEKDTNARALEEMYFGAARELSSFMLVQIDEGVGSGVVVGGTLYRGANGMGTEIGHTSICYNGPACSCGGRGCLETYVRVPALLQGSRFADWAQLAAEASAPDACAILDHAAECLTAALVNAFNLYDLEKVLLTGDVLHCPEPLLDRLNPLVTGSILSRGTVQAPPVAASAAAVPVRTGAMAVVHDYFQERG